MSDGGDPVRPETDAGGTTGGIASNARRAGPFPQRIRACRCVIDSRDYLFTTRTDGPRRRSKPMQAKRFEELKATGLLPSPTGIGLEILRLTRDENVSASQIGRVIQADPALTGRTLRLANTGNAASARAVANVAEAVARLGTRTVSAIALGFTVLAGNRSGKCRGFDYQRFWSHSLARAVATQVLAGHTRHSNAADGFTAGLLAQIGRLALASIHTEQYATVLDQWRHGSADSLTRLEQLTFVTDHNELPR